MKYVSISIAYVHHHQLQADGKIAREGSERGGYWKINE
jgi:hypothetical protein